MLLPNSLIKQYVIIGLALVLWLLVFNQGIFTAVDVWLVSEIYNHCLFVLPCSVYFIYRKRHLIHCDDIKPTFLPLIPLTFMVFLQLFAAVGGINILMHIATFTALPLIIWLCVGHRVARTLAFPLFFMMFAIPIGDELIPYLQELTTDIAVPLLELTNVPIYRNGLYLDIPEGRFLVAEACSGISFLISSIVFGFLYAYISFSSLKKRAIFVCISIIVPILANALRVYGIVLTGHLSDMQYAVGADHLIYGGVFYTIVLFILILIGEKFRDKKINGVNSALNNEKSCETVINTRECKILPVLIFGLIVTIQQAWLYNISQAEEPVFAIPDSVSNITVEPAFSQINYISQSIPDWQPYFKESDIEVTGVIKDVQIDTFITYYSGVKGELIASSHRLFDSEEWSLINNRSKTVHHSPVILSYIASQRGHHRYLLHWYEVNGKHFNSTSKAKVYQAYLMLLGKEASGVKIILTVDTRKVKLNDLVDYVDNHFSTIRLSLYQALQNNAR